MQNKTSNILLFLILVVLVFNTVLSYFQYNRTKAFPVALSSDQVLIDSGVAPIKSIPDLPPTSIHFEKMKHDFGVIPDNKKVYTSFTFTNTGKEPLLIYSAEATCGCTVPEWPKEPIPPGESGKIEVAFDPDGKKGEHSKTVVIKANTEPSTTVLIVSASIVPSN